MTLVRHLTAMLLVVLWLKSRHMLACPPYSGEVEETCDTPPANSTTDWYRTPAHHTQLMRLDVNVHNSKILAHSEPGRLKENLCFSNKINRDLCPETESTETTTFEFEDVCNESFPFSVDFPNRHSDKIYQEQFDCPWVYICEYKPKRIPAILVHADCTEPPEGAGYGCKEIRYAVPVLKTEACPLRGNETWNLTLERVAVGCARYSR